MKTVYRISIILNVLFAGYILIRGSEILIKEHLINNATSGQQIEYEENKVSETAAAEEHITCDTVYTISEYDLSTGRQEVYQHLLPTSFIGMNRTQLMEWMEDYNRHAFLNRKSGYVNV